MQNLKDKLHLMRDTLKAGRDRPFRKIGEGQFSTVWLARDTERNRYVAIKIGFTWFLKSQVDEVSVMKLLRDSSVNEQPGKNHVVKLLDDFVQDGPNGSHVCIVTKPLGRQVEMALSDFDLESPAPYLFCRTICIQALHALGYLHRQRVMHGDFHPGNILLALTYEIDSQTEALIKAHNQRGNDLNDPDDPYTLDDQTLISAEDSSNVHIVLVDLGASTTPANTPNNKFAYPILYRAPEVVMDVGPITAKADIWAIGCVIFRIITGIPLFAPECWGNTDEANLEQIVGLVERLGSVPDSLRTAWLDPDSHLTSDGLLKNPYPEYERGLPLDEAIWEVKPSGMGEDELVAFIDFMSLIFLFEPAERSPTEELLQHRWAQERFF
ncbi:hypothetical protein N7493_011115 [Penicillium malachiteum]|uniref:Protein kinase domain-containing protein n=1 Tax=Penicillium malachiteum TaxID=1324776 RepID=A0AAD6HBP0_9EURO|nr:hypothetical protein N7493_011115 [Penicillium malachiteum]